MKWKFMAKTVGFLLAALGLADLPVSAENQEMNLSAEQEEIAKKLLGESYEDVRKAINGELKEMADSNFDLQSVQAEIDAMTKALALKTDAEANVPEAERGDKTITAQLSGLHKKYEDLFAKMANEGVGDTGKVINLNGGKQMRNHSTTHLNASNESFDAFEGRPWNQRAAGVISGGVSNFNDKVDIPLLQGDMEHFVRKNPTSLQSIFDDFEGLPKEWSKLTGVIDRVVSGYVAPSEVTQANNGGWNPKGAILITTEEGRVYDKKIDITLTGKRLKEIEKSWLTFMNGNDGSHPWKTTFVGFLLGEYIKQAALDSRIAQINGIFVQQPAEVTGMNINSQNGLRWNWWYNKEVTKKYTPFDIGEPTEENIVDHIEELIYRIPEHRRQEQGYEIELSHYWLKKYRERAGALYQLNFNTDSGMHEYKEMYPVDRPNFKFQPLLDQTNTKFIGITKSKNVEELQYMESEKNEFTLTHDKRDTNIFADFKEGIRFIQVGRKLLPGDPKEFEYQRIYSNNVPVFGPETRVPLFDKGTTIVEFKFPEFFPHVQIVQNDYGQNIESFEGGVTGMVVSIQGLKTLSANRLVKSNANLLLTADFQLNTGGTLTMVVQPDGKLKEVNRTTTPSTAATSDKTFNTATLDAKEGTVFNFNGLATTAITSILNGVEGKTITIKGTDAAGVNVTLSTVGNVKVNTAATLATNEDTITLTYVNGMWYEINRVIA